MALGCKSGRDNVRQQLDRHPVEISGHDPRKGPWTHRAFRPAPLPRQSPLLQGSTYLAIADSRAALAALDSTARRLPNPTLLRRPTLRREAQATSALEGTYAPLSDVLTADEERPGSADLREILNYVQMANHAFGWIGDGRPLSLGMLEDLQRLLVTGTSSDGPSSGQVRDIQVAIGRRADAALGELPIRAARFVPPPPGDDLVGDLRELLDWMRADHTGEFDPVVACAMAHYQFETLHPFNDGNGRIGRLLVILHLHAMGLLEEPTLTISPWFEARRTDYYERLLGVSVSGDWDSYVEYFATGLRESAELTHRQMLALVRVQADLKEVVRGSSLRADSALLLVDFSVANPSFSVKAAARGLGVSVGRANALVATFIELGLLEPWDAATYNRRFYAPRVMDVLLDRG